MNILNLFLLSLILTLMNLRNSFLQSSPSIYGTWNSESDSLSQWKFIAPDTCLWLYNGETDLESTFIYSISSTCGKESDKAADFLRLETINDTTDFYCYDIVGLTDSTFSYIDLLNGKIELYYRDKD